MRRSTTTDELAKCNKDRSRGLMYVGIDSLSDRDNGPYYNSGYAINEMRHINQRPHLNYVTQSIEFAVTAVTLPQL